MQTILTSTGRQATGENATSKARLMTADCSHFALAMVVDVVQLIVAFCSGPPKPLWFSRF
jgi:hypothetical protein